MIPEHKARSAEPGMIPEHHQGYLSNSVVEKKQTKDQNQQQRNPQEKKHWLGGKPDNQLKYKYKNINE